MTLRRPAPLVATLVLALVAASCRLPDLKEERRQASALPQTSFLYAADGTTLITQLHAGEDRVVVPFGRMPEVMRDAAVAIEDKRFYQHSGIDLKAVLRAAYVDVTTGRVVEGGSTITQQLVKNLYLGSAQTLARKAREALLAWQLEHRISKDQILTKYLNTVYFGNGAYGVQAAAQTYFDQDAAELTLPQAALLAGLIAAPVDYDPVSYPDRALARRDKVLAAMLEQGMIDVARHQAAVATPIELDMGDDGETRYIAPYFVDYFKEWFLSNPRFGATVEERYDLLFKGGLRIQTTLVPRLQELAEEAVDQVLIYRSDPYAAMTVIDPRTGYVKAMVGGRDYWDERDELARVNLATGGSTGRQAGSAFKTFALVAALERGFSPQSPLNASFASIPLLEGGFYTPKNYDGSAQGTISLESATVRSVNIAYVNLIRELGAGDAYEGSRILVETAVRMGIRCCPRTTEPNKPLAAFPSAVLGTNEVNTLEMASAHGTLANEGYHVQPTPVMRITSAGGEVLYESVPKPKPVVNPAVAHVANQILQDVVRYGTGVAADIGRPQFGKTGTAQEHQDAWFVGAIPQLVTAVWVGFPQGQIPMTYPRVRISRVAGGTWPAQIWHAFMFNATRNMPVREFPAPAELDYVTLRIDVTQGCLANPFTPPMNIQTLQFIAGTEPLLEVCEEPTEYQLLRVPSVIGLTEEEAKILLRSSGFNVKVVTEKSTQLEGTVIAQRPSSGEMALMTSTVTITVAKGQPAPVDVVVPDVLGMTEGAAEAALRKEGFAVDVIFEAECDPADPTCDYQAGIVWAQSPAGGATAPDGSTVTIRVNP